MLYYFADGHKIAKMLSSLISKESRMIRDLLEEYCVNLFGVAGITLPGALDPMLISSRL